MIGALYTAGVLMLVFSIIGAFSAGGFLNFFVVLISGIVSSLIMFGAAKILENQEDIKYKLDLYAKNFTKSSDKKKTCEKCSKGYDPNLRSCPYCGHRE